jgi:hypothetical protein
MRVSANCKPWLMLIAVLLGAMPLVCAADQEVAQRFFSGSISSPETAQHALDDIAGARARIEATYAEDQRRCYGKFFVNHCLSQAREHRRVSLELLTPIEVEANQFLRQRKVDERDAGLAREAEEREARRQQNALMPSAERADISDQREPSALSPRPDVTPADTAGKSERERKHEESVLRRKAGQEAEAAERAQKVAAFERKQQQAKERQEKVARRKAERDKHRQEGVDGVGSALK